MSACEIAALGSDQKTWETLLGEHEESMRGYLERASLEAAHAEYGYYVDAEVEDGVPASDIATFEEWYEKRHTPDYV